MSLDRFAGTITITRYPDGLFTEFERGLGLVKQGMAGAAPAVEPTLVINIGTEAVGVESLRRFFSSLPVDGRGYAFVVHRDDESQSELTLDEIENLSGRTTVSAADGMELEPDRVYVVPRGLRMTVSDGRLVRSPRPAPRHDSTKPLRPDDSATTKASFHQIAEATPAMMWSVGPDGSTWRNAGMRRWLGLTDEENPLWLGNASVRFIHPEDRHRIEAGVREVLSHGRPWNSQYRLLHAGGEYRWVSAAVNPLHMEDGSIHSVGVITDIHDRLALEQSLRKVNQDLERRVAERTQELAVRNERLRRRNEVLDQFAHAASHDLRAPLRTIRSYITLLDEELTSGDSDMVPVTELTDRIGSSAERMQRLLEALLRYSNVGRREFEPHPMDPTESVQAAVENLHADIDRSGATIEIGELPSALADRDALTEVFNNVISNAIRYQGSEPPRIAVAGNTLDDDTVRIDITDNGRGFDPRFEEAVFEPFRRLSGIDEAGTGLGLAICARIMERLGGTITATSTPGTGTTITLQLRGEED